MALFLPTYFSPISQYSAILKSEKILFEVHDNYQKQSYRNRCYIYNTNGKQLLNIPVKHPVSSVRKKTKNTQIENIGNWQKQHFNSLKIAYRNSPFFEFYVDDIAFIFDKKYKYLQDVNIDTFLFVSDALQLNLDFKSTNSYASVSKEEDYRSLVVAKSLAEKSSKQYIQMFDEKHGFIPDLSILDLLFMEGPNTINFL
ncbi:WbqC family protein [Polaribacter sp.]|jgi:hypothetical protein|nr:WbqC family protein [Polaribacter sp.]|tara:strand:+ start:25716 stop:26312 length:597 start_codon:yes stop_codon:yes gene_type:complete